MYKCINNNFSEFKEYQSYFQAGKTYEGKYYGSNLILRGDDRKYSLVDENCFINISLTL